MTRDPLPTWPMANRNRTFMQTYYTHVWMDQSLDGSLWYASLGRIYIYTETKPEKWVSATEWVWYKLEMHSMTSSGAIRNESRQTNACRFRLLMAHKVKTPKWRKESYRMRERKKERKGDNRQLAERQASSNRSRIFFQHVRQKEKWMNEWECECTRPPHHHQASPLHHHSVMCV